MPQLYKLINEYDELYDIALNEAEDGELSPAFERLLHGIEDEIHGKLKACCAVAKNLESEFQAFDTEAKRLKKRAAFLKSRVEWMKDYIKENMVRLGLKKTDTIPGASIVNNSQPSVVIEDESEVPDKYCEIERRVKKSMLAELAKLGQPLPNTVRVERGTHLRLK